VIDEAQNATVAQMKMVLTRLGERAKYAVTGDPTQTDLPHGQPSGLAHALAILEGIKGIEQIKFLASDVVRHPLVGKIVDAYEKDSPTRYVKKSEGKTSDRAGVDKTVARGASAD